MDATGGLANKRVQLEQFFQDNRTYLGAPACTADTTLSTNFDFSCTVQTALTYTLQANGKSAMLGFSYTIDQNNTKASTTSWGNNASCWVTKQGGTC